MLRCLTAFCTAVTKNSSAFIQFPTSAEAAEIADRIEQQRGYTQAFAALDGSHIAVSPPSVGLADYLNRKIFASIVLPGLVDDRYMFRDVSCKCRGSMHDSTVFTNSSLATRIEHAMPVRDRAINGVNVPLYKYPLSPRLIKGYTGRNLTPEEVSFNVYHSSAQMMVENAFGRLKVRWRMVCKRMDCDVNLSPYVIMTCCCLHNICEKLKMPITQQQIENAVNHPDNQQLMPETELRVLSGGSAIRDAITNHLAQTSPLRASIHYYIINLIKLHCKSTDFIEINKKVTMSFFKYVIQNYVNI